MFAAALDLQPLPIGEATLVGKIPYGIKIFQWTIVGLSTLFGAAFWYRLLQSFSMAGLRPTPPLEKTGPAGDAASYNPPPPGDAAAPAAVRSPAS